jgi:hypothetical protein
VTSPGNQTSPAGSPVSLQIHASDSQSGQTLTYSATGLPAGLSINSATGLITGTPTTAGTSPWTSTAGVLASTADGVPAHSGSWLAWLDGYGGSHTDTLAQTVTIRSGCKNATLSFWLYIDTTDPTNRASDTFKIQVLSSSGTVLATLATLSNQNSTGGYSRYSYSVAPYIGQKITIKYTGTETLGGR